MYDFVIIGGGPTGIALAMILSETNYKTLIIEQSDKLGGCWKTDWVDNLYHSEHSPKVLFRSNVYFFQLLNIINVKPQLKDVYNNYFKTSMMLLSFFADSLSLGDVGKINKSYFAYLTGRLEYYESVKRWMDRINLSKKGRKAISTLCITLSNIPSKMCVGVLFEYFSTNIFGASIVQLSNPNEWIDSATEYLKKKSNIAFKFNTKIDYVHKSNESNTIKYISCNQGRKFLSKHFVFCVPLIPLFEICKKSYIEDNWVDDMRNFVNKSTYTGIGIQLHFDKYEDAIINKKWCWSCNNDWSIIVTQKDKILKTFTKDRNVKSVWSCVIVDIDTKSSRINKSAKECEEEELIDELLYQLSYEYGKKIVPYKITLHKDLRKNENNEWTSIHSSYSNTIGAFPYEGKLSNLYAIGPHNTGKISTIEESIKSAILFGNEKLLNRLFVTQESYLDVLIVIVIMFFIFIY